MRALELGPAHLPDGIFARGRDRALAGMKVHANTISHARLVALEDTFPRTRALLGAELFNEYSRRFLHPPGETARALALIGGRYPPFLAEVGAARGAVDLARFEWCWLEAYHAAEAPSLKLGELAGLAGDALMAVTLDRHPAAFVDEFDAMVLELIGREVPGLVEAKAILLTRPDAEVLVSPATAEMAGIFALLDAPSSIGNLFVRCTEPAANNRLEPEEFMPALIALIEAGTLQQVK